jgi:biopolymer transport protein ExbD
MTPLIDVVFLLLVFFIVASAQNLREDLLPLTLPAGQIEAPPAAAPEDRPRVWIRLERDGEGTRAVYNEAPFTLPQLFDQLRELAEVDASVEVVLDVGADVPFGDMIAAYDHCRSAGLADVSFSIDFE